MDARTTAALRSRDARIREQNIQLSEQYAQLSQQQAEAVAERRQHAEEASQLVRRNVRLVKRVNELARAREEAERSAFELRAELQRVTELYHNTEELAESLDRRLRVDDVPDLDETRYDAAATPTRTLVGLEEGLDSPAEPPATPSFSLPTRPLRTFQRRGGLHAPALSLLSPLVECSTGGTAGTADVLSPIRPAAAATRRGRPLHSPLSEPRRSKEALPSPLHDLAAVPSATIDLAPASRSLRLPFTPSKAALSALAGTTVPATAEARVQVLADQRQSVGQSHPRAVVAPPRKAANGRAGEPSLGSTAGLREVNRNLSGGPPKGVAFQFLTASESEQDRLAGRLFGR